MIRMYKNVSKWEVVMFCCVESLCEGVDSNQWLPLQCKHCMNIKDVYSGKSDVYSYVHVEMAFVLASTIPFNIWTFSKIEGILCIHVVRNMGQFTYSQCTPFHGLGKLRVKSI